MSVEKDLIAQAIALLEALQGRPTSSLSPFVGDLEKLSSEYRQLTQSATTPPRSPGPSRRDPKSALAPSATYKDQVRLLVDAALNVIPELTTAALSFAHPAGITQAQAQRNLHVQSIFLLQRRKGASKPSTQEKILLVCASLSLAKDFSAFERSGGWIPKIELLARRILNGEDTSVQKIGKHLGNYIATQDSGDQAESVNRQTLEAACRFGIKLEVLEHIGRALRLPSCLTLLMGYECVKFSRLGFSAFGTLQQRLIETTTKQRIFNFGNVMDQWWNACQADYHGCFGSMPSNTLSASLAIRINSTSPALKHDTLNITDSSIAQYAPSLEQLHSDLLIEQPFDNQNVWPNQIDQQTNAIAEQHQAMLSMDLMLGQQVAMPGHNTWEFDSLNGLSKPSTTADWEQVEFDWTA